MSVLEGGYDLRGAHCSAFARSVAGEQDVAQSCMFPLIIPLISSTHLVAKGHVRALVEKDSRKWDPLESEVREIDQ